MHHYWVKEAGDPEAIGEYFPTGEERGDGVPIYRRFMSRHVSLKMPFGRLTWQRKIIATQSSSRSESTRGLLLIDWLSLVLLLGSGVVVAIIDPRPF